MLDSVDYLEYKYLSISTTSKHNQSLLRLPDREYSEGKSLNLLITSEEVAFDTIKYFDGKIENIVVDIERKQEINLFEIARKVVRNSKLYTNKPNDLTMEAVDTLLLKQFSQDLSNKKILIYGTGNIAFKLALRLAERNAKVLLDGRDKQKVEKLSEALNLVLPKYCQGHITPMNKNSMLGELNAFVSVVSVEQVINKEYVSLLGKDSVSIDVGIGNFSTEFIESALEMGSIVVRLDVRISMPHSNASLEVQNNQYRFFTDIMGRKLINDIEIVAGGIIGKEGTIIVDRVKNPKQIIGIANGYGGVKNETELTETERKNIKIIEQSVRKYD